MCFVRRRQIVTLFKAFTCCDRNDSSNSTLRSIEAAKILTQSDAAGKPPVQQKQNQPDKVADSAAAFPQSDTAAPSALMQLNAADFAVQPGVTATFEKSLAILKAQIAEEETAATASNSQDREASVIEVLRQHRELQPVAKALTTKVISLQKKLSSKAEALQKAQAELDAMHHDKKLLLENHDQEAGKQRELQQACKRLEDGVQQVQEQLRCAKLQIMQQQNASAQLHQQYSQELILALDR